MDNNNLGEYGAEVNFEYGEETPIADPPDDDSPRNENETAQFEETKIPVKEKSDVEEN